MICESSPHKPHGTGLGFHNSGDRSSQDYGPDKLYDVASISMISTEQQHGLAPRKVNHAKDKNGQKHFSKPDAVYQKSQRAKEKGLAPGKVNHAEDKKGRKNFHGVHQKSQSSKDKGLAFGKVNHAEDKKGRKNFHKHDGVYQKSQPSKEKAPSFPWSSSDEESVGSDESDDLVCHNYQGILLNQLGHETFDPVGKFCLQHYNDKHNTSYEFVELVWAGVQLMLADCEYHLTLKVKNPTNCLVEVFQAKSILTSGTVGLGNLEYREVLDCKISDVPYVEISDDVPLTPVRIAAVRYEAA